ncbi:hypothetical protein SAMN05444166_2841 [Singulisphaera sp. GP187]|uniref:hypothetical protein n=1 Tax=Singulisphaera sp. GP187 TaxID=1882752 RepID=UPI0009268A7D|nr:hypothetical protein [Singulisphaera sp. GP187]SIO17784.1 hypothetical protein SAMN05444166_2841 [Singulisphaera sp. GP187]
MQERFTRFLPTTQVGGCLASFGEDAIQAATSLAPARLTILVMSAVTTRALLFLALALLAAALTILATATAVGLALLAMFGQLDLASACFTAPLLAIASAMLVLGHTSVLAITPAVFVLGHTSVLAITPAVFVLGFASLLAIAPAVFVLGFASLLVIAPTMLVLGFALGFAIATRVGTGLVAVT